MDVLATLKLSSGHGDEELGPSAALLPEPRPSEYVTLDTKFISEQLRQKPQYITLANYVDDPTQPAPAVRSAELRLSKSDLESIEVALHQSLQHLPYCIVWTQWRSHSVEREILYSLLSEEGEPLILTINGTNMELQIPGLLKIRSRRQRTLSLLDATLLKDRGTIRSGLRRLAKRDDTDKRTVQHLSETFGQSTPTLAGLLGWLIEACNQFQRSDLVDDLYGWIPRLTVLLLQAAVLVTGGSGAYVSRPMIDRDRSTYATVILSTEALFRSLTSIMVDLVRTKRRP